MAVTIQAFATYKYIIMSSRWQHTSIYTVQAWSVPDLVLLIQSIKFHHARPEAIMVVSKRNCFAKLSTNDILQTYLHIEFEKSLSCEQPTFAITASAKATIKSATGLLLQFWRHSSTIFNHKVSSSKGTLQDRSKLTQKCKAPATNESTNNFCKIKQEALPQSQLKLTLF